jgi:GTPase SAR1 family protein
MGNKKEAISIIRCAKAIIFVYDVSREDSLYELKNLHYPLVRETCNNFGEIIKFVVANKSDLPKEEQVVSETDVRDWISSLNEEIKADEEKWNFIEVSAKTGKGVRDMFNETIMKGKRRVWLGNF